MENIRSATSILTELRDGQVIAELSVAIHEALAAVKEHNKAGEVYLTIKIAPLNANKLVEPAIMMIAEVDKKLPKQPPPSTIFFINDDGNATRTPVKQEKLAFGVAAPSSNPQAEGNGQSHGS
jgi:hypothetical protein